MMSHSIAWAWEQDHWRCTIYLFLASVTFPQEDPEKNGQSCDILTWQGFKRVPSPSCHCVSTHLQEKWDDRELMIFSIIERLRCRSIFYHFQLERDIAIAKHQIIWIGLVKALILLVWLWLLRTKIPFNSKGQNGNDTIFMLLRFPGKLCRRPLLANLSVQF